jgi:hypothetical protein
MGMTIRDVLATPTLGAVLLFGAMITLPERASAFWPILGRPITTAPKGQVHSVITTDGAGGAIIAWEDQRNNRVNIFARRVLASGELDPAWPDLGRELLRDTLALVGTDGGQTTPLLVPDGSGRRSRWEGPAHRGHGRGSVRAARAG